MFGCTRIVKKYCIGTEKRKKKKVGYGYRCSLSLATGCEGRIPQPVEGFGFRGRDVKRRVKVYPDYS